MTRKKIEVPSRLTFQNSIDFVRGLRSLKPHAEFEFDFCLLKTLKLIEHRKEFLGF